jgi:acetoin utilization deacetylase AcuC-like enzyme
MTLFYYDPLFQEHLTGDHPENGGRIRSVVRHLNFVRFDTSCLRPSWYPASVDRLCYVHSHEYVDFVREFAERGGGRIEQDTIVSERSYDVARLAVGAVCDAVERVVDGQAKTAFCLVRPPGHHAMSDHAMGFCLFNNVAVGVRVAQRELGIERVLIVDFDVHHGNGTQATFYDDPSVGYFSMHRSPFYPDTGAVDETGIGAGVGTTRNLPIAFGTPREQQLTVFRFELERFADHIQPHIIFISAGFDSHKNDPIGSLDLESQDFAELTRSIIAVARKHSLGRIISVLEGGYNPEALVESVDYHLEELLKSS